MVGAVLERSLWARQASAGTVNWYAAATGGASLGTVAELPNAEHSHDHDLYVDATISGCTTASRTAVVATVTPLPSITGTTPGEEWYGNGHFGRDCECGYP